MLTRITIKKYRNFLSMGNFVSFRGYKDSLETMSLAGEKHIHFARWVLEQEKSVEGLPVMSATLRSRHIELRIKGDVRSQKDPLIEDMKAGDRYYEILGENGLFLVHDYAISPCVGIRYIPYPGSAEKYI